MPVIQNLITSFSQFIDPQPEPSLTNCRLASTSFLFDTPNLDQNQFLIPSHLPGHSNFTDHRFDHRPNHSPGHSNFPDHFSGHSNFPVHSPDHQQELHQIVQDFKATEFFRAAQLLLDLSSNRGSLLSLEKRMQLMAKALVCLDSANGQIDRMRGEICGMLDLAMVQQKLRLKLQFIPTNMTLKREFQKIDNELLNLMELRKLSNEYNFNDLQQQLSQFESGEDEDKENRN